MRPDGRPADAHRLLGIELGASRAEIRPAYRRRALEVHPDVAGSDSTADMAALNAARDQLLEGVPARRTVKTTDETGPTSRRHGAGPAGPSYDHAPTWDDYWAAWNDPPRRPKP